MAFSERGSLNLPYFFLGFLGVILVLGAVEFFNEYFDFKEGGDRIFSKEIPCIPGYFFYLGISALLLAFFIGLYFASRCGWPVLLFAFLGFMASYFYVGPPIRWAYRGLGEVVIGLSYGPLMILSSFFIQTRHISPAPILVSLICGLAIFSIAVLNEVPDYYQDRLVGKRNLVVRLGKNKAIILSAAAWILVFTFLGMILLLKMVPLVSLIAFLLTPAILKSLRIARARTDNPSSFMPTIRTSLLSYVVLMCSLGIGYLVR